METKIKTIDINTILLVEKFQEFSKCFVFYNEHGTYEYDQEYVSYNHENKCFEYVISQQKTFVDLEGELHYQTKDEKKKIKLSLHESNFDKLILEIEKVMMEPLEIEKKEKFNDWFIDLCDWFKKIDSIEDFNNNQTLEIVSYIRNLKKEFQWLKFDFKKQNKELEKLLSKEKEKNEALIKENKHLNLKIFKYEELISSYKAQITQLELLPWWKRILKLK